MTLGCLIVSLKICSNAFLTAIPCLGLSGFNHSYLDKIWITTIINLNPSLCFESLLTSTKLICHCSSIWCTTTGLVLKLRRIGLCRVYANCEFSHSSTSPIDIFASCFFASCFWDHSIVSSVAPPYSLSCGFPFNWEFSTKIWELQHASKQSILFKNSRHIILLSPWNLITFFVYLDLL